MINKYYLNDIKIFILKEKQQNQDEEWKKISEIMFKMQRQWYKKIINKEELSWKL